MNTLKFGVLVFIGTLMCSCNSHEHSHNESGANHAHSHDEEHLHEHDGDSLETDNDLYDHDLATKLRADEYGMATYVIAFLKTGPNKSPNKEAKDKMQAAHMANMNKLAEDGKLVMAGPFFDDPIMRGLYIFDVETVEEAAALTATDPMIENGILIMELKKWYGSAGLREMNDLYYKIAKTVM